ncbi:MAG: M20/M25/M40 family metallo-hydrolase [Patescibacteria group bacterium]
MSENLFSTSNILEITKKLIRIPSIKNNREALQQAIFLTEEFLKNTPGIIAKKYKSRDLSSIVFLTHDTKIPDVLLIGHLDVVPGSDNQFDSIEKDGKIYGRGACDMKSGVAVLLELFRYFATQNQKPSLGLMLTPDEESGGSDGVRYLTEEQGFRAKIAIIPDGGNAPDELVIENKGALHLQIKATGKTAHASRPWEGENAAQTLIEAITRIRSLFEGEYSDTWKNTCVLSKIEAGKAVNQVPDRATAVLDIRYVKETDDQELLDKIKQVASPCKIEILVHVVASKTDENHKFINLYRSILKDKFNLNTKIIRSPGGNDGRFLTTHDIPIIVSRPISGGLHGPLEWVDIKGLEDYALFYKSYLENLFMQMAGMNK